MDNKSGCVYGAGAMILAAFCTVILLAIMGPAIGNVFSNVIDGLESSALPYVVGIF